MKRTACSVACELAVLARLEQTAHLRYIKDAVRAAEQAGDSETARALAQVLLDARRRIDAADEQVATVP